MSKLKKVMRRKTTWFFILLFAFVYINNSSYLIKKSNKKPLLLAHRGLAQTFSMEGITGETNTAQRIYKPEHPYLENTIPSMEAAFKAGADIVEFDIQLTKDGQFAVFHDHALEYRTNEAGNIKEYTMEELKKLDIGYGYTADKGKTFPFRGEGIGLMPSLEEVINYFPESSFLIHIKSNDPKDGELLAQYFSTLLKERLAKLTVYGGNEPIAMLKQKLPNLRVMSKATMKKALISYMAVGWTGYIPESMKNTYFHLPEKYARILWGWPHRFTKRMDKANSIFVVVAGDGQWSEGFDTVEDLKQIPDNYLGGIWTNRIDRIAPVFNKNNRVSSYSAQTVVEKHFQYRNEKNKEKLLTTLTKHWDNPNMKWEFENLDSIKIIDIEEERDERIKRGYLGNGRGNINGVTEDNVKVYKVKYEIKFINDEVGPQDSGTYTWWYFLIREDNKSPWLIDDFGV